MKHCKCSKGPPGAMGLVVENPQLAINEAIIRFGVGKEEILLGYRKTPPKVKWCKVYIYYNGGAAEFWIKRNGDWINWGYSD